MTRLIINTEDEFKQAIETISTEDCDITDIIFFYLPDNNDIFSRFTNALKNNNTLISIDLSDNEIGDTRAKSLAEALKENNTLTSIDLSNNQISDTGAESLAEALKVNNNLNYVHLSNNHISDTGAESLAKALKVNNNITFIDLGGNNISGVGAIDLAEALAINNTITNIQLYYNNICSVGAEALSRALEINNTITNMNIEGNHIDDDRAEALTEAIEMNQSFLLESLRVLIAKETLSDDQDKTIKAHYAQIIEGSLEFSSEELKEKFTQYIDNQFRESMDNYKGRMRDPALVISNYLSENIDKIHFDQAMVNKYFRGTLPKISLETVNSFNNMIEKSNDLKKAILLPNSALFISDALKKGMEFNQIIINLDRINADSNTKKFALENPKKLGYLMTLEEDKLKKAIGILNHPELEEDIKRKPEKIAALTKALGDLPEELRDIKFNIFTHSSFEEEMETSTRPFSPDFSTSSNSSNQQKMDIDEINRKRSSIVSKEPKGRFVEKIDRERGDEEREGKRARISSKEI